MRVFGMLGIDTVWDVGANEGQYASILRSVGYRRKIESFEPAPSALSQLRKLSDRDPLWRVHPVALGERNERREFFQFESTVLNSFHAPSQEGLNRFQSMHRPEPVSVNVRSGEEVWEELYPTEPPRLFLKIDTQGHDRAVLDGLRGKLDQVLGIQLELSLIPIYEKSEHYLETLRWLDQSGFEMTSLFPLVRAKGLRLLEVDCIAVRKNR